MSSGFPSPLSIHLDAERTSCRCLSNDFVHVAESEQKSPSKARRTSGEVKDYHQTTLSCSLLYGNNYQDIICFQRIHISRSLWTPESVVLLCVFVWRAREMIGGGNGMDVKLRQNPLVVLVKIEELQRKCDERNSTMLNDPNPKNLNEEKIKFLGSLGLVPIESLQKHSSKSLNPMPRRCRSSNSCNRPISTGQYCVSVHFPNKLPTRKSWDREVSSNSCCKSKQLNGRQLKLSPRICLKKWLGGERVVNTKRDFEILENALIPKTDNHSCCKEKPKTYLSPLNCSTGTIPREIPSRDKESCATSREGMDGYTVKVPGWDNDINLRKYRFRLLRSHSPLPNGLRPGMLLPNESEGRSSHSDLSNQKSNGVSDKMKEVQICVKKWQGEGVIDISKEKMKIEDLLAVPPGISHRSCRKAKVLEKSLNATK